MAQMPEIGGKRYAGNDPAMKQVWNYIYQLEEQLRYAFNHIGSDNLEEGAVTGKHIAAESVTADKISSSAGNELNIQSNKAITLTAKDLKQKGKSIAQLRIDTEKIASRVADTEGNVSTLQQTAKGLESRVQDAEGNVSELSQTVNGFEQRVADTEGNVSTLQQTAKGLESRVKDTEGNITTLQQTAQGLEIRAESAEEILEGLGTRVTEAEASLTVQAGQIAAKAEKTTVEDLTGRVTEAEADLTVQAGEIAARAKQTDLDKLSGRVTTAEASLTVQAGEISLKASKTEVKDAVDDIEIGGRNILTKRPESTHRSSNITMTDYGFNIAPVNQDTYMTITTHEDIVKGEEYTLSMECSGFGEGEEWPFYLFGQWDKRFVLKNGKVIHTVQAPGDYGKWFTMDDHNRDKMPSGTVTVKNLKMERGNKATAWTPAPEDAEERIAKAEAELAVQAGEISMRATKEEVDNISVGGKNMLKNGDFSQGPYVAWSSCPEVNSPGATDEAFGIKYSVRCYPDKQWILFQKVNLEANTDYTFSMYARKVDHNITENFPVWITLDGWLACQTQPITKAYFSTQGRVWATFNTGSNSGQVSVYFRTNRPDLNQSLDLAQIKLEKGNKPTDWTPAPEDPVQTLKNTAMTLNAEGIEMTTTGHFRLYANDGKNSMIKLGGDDETANFSVTETGKLGAISGEFTEGLKVRNYPVWTRQNIIISSSQPTNVHDVLWIQPLQGVQQTSHNFTNDGSYHFNSGVARSYTLTPQSNDVLTPGGRYEYSLSFPMTLGTNTSSPKDFTVSAVISNASGSVTLTGQAVSLWGWGNVDIKLMGTSSVNLCASSGNITAAVTVSGGGGGNTSMYIPGGKELILTSKNTAASSAGAQTCTIHYIQ